MQTLSDTEMREAAEKIVNRFEGLPRWRWTDEALFVYQLAKEYLR